VTGERDAGILLVANELVNVSRDVQGLHASNERNARFSASK
jgi:hypothetical protein